MGATALMEAATLFKGRLRTALIELPEEALALPEALSDLALVGNPEGLPDWWAARGNMLMCIPGEPLPGLHAHPGLEPPHDALVVVGRRTVCPTIILWGAAPRVAIGHHVRLADGQIACGGHSTIVICDRTACTFAPEVNCRNGGTIYVGADGLWASHVRLYSDDMHAIRALTDNRRINTFGGSIHVAPHVWLGLEVLVMAGARIGADVIVGARALVNGRLPAQTVAVGSPARAVRHGVTWTHADEP